MGKWIQQTKAGTGECLGKTRIVDEPTNGHGFRDRWAT